MGETGYLISRAGAFVGNESGPAHWAASLGVATIALFGGHSAPGEWGPHGARLIGAEVACSPCHRRYCSGKGVACLSSVRPELVGSGIRDVLASATSSGSSAR